MTRDDVAAAIIQKVLVREGGIANVGDGKGVTSFGQTKDWLEEFGLPVPTTVAQAALNYRAWLDLTKLIEVCDVLDSLADATIDFAVHSHHPRAIRALQSAIGARPDGVIGPATISALAGVNRRQAAADLIADRSEFQYGLFASNPEKHLKFARGWGRRMGEQIRGLGLALVVVLLTGTAANAQTPDTPKPDSRWLHAVIAGVGITAYGDTYLTGVILGQGVAREGNPILAWSVDRPLGLGVLKGAIAAGQVTALIKLHRSHPRWTYVLGGASIALNSYAMAHNAKLRRK